MKLKQHDYKSNRLFDKDQKNYIGRVKRHGMVLPIKKIELW